MAPILLEFIKIKIDAMLIGDIEVGLDCVARKEEGKVLVVAAKHVRRD